jgi:toxin ParE1/3/4
MNRFRLSLRAKTDLAEIHRYIAQDAAPAADRFVGEFFDLFHLLARNPEIGQQRTELRPSLRSISHGSYVVFFYPMVDGVEIAGVVHGARDVDALFRAEQR